MILLAHDGSIYSDWVARYALRFAALEPDHKLVVLHVHDGKLNRDVVELRLNRLVQDCLFAGIDCIIHQLLLSQSVHRTLRQAVPHDPTALLVCGTRIKSKKNFYLSGTVAEKLLRMHQCPVLALRVVQPGLLGAPHDLLLPLAGHLDGLRRLWPIFSRFVPQLQIVHLFRALTIHPLLLQHLTPTREQRLQLIGEKHLSETSTEILAQIPDNRIRIDRRVLISTDWVNDLLIQANRLKVQLLLLGVSERSLAHRVIHGDKVEQVLRETACDVGIYRGP